MFKNLDELRAKIREFKLDRLEDKIVSLAKPAIRMNLTAADDTALPPGASKMGGLPDLPADFQWRYFKGKPLTFIGQFKLSEITPYDTDGILPDRGMLYFFFEDDEVTWGETEQQRGWQILYIEDENLPLVRTPHPDYQGKRGMVHALPSHGVEYNPVLSLPVIFYSEDEGSDFGMDFVNIPGEPPEHNFDHLTEHSPYVKMLLEQPTEHTVYFKLLDSSPPEPRHYWFGHPHRIQAEVEWDVVTESNRIQPQGDPATGDYGYTDEQVAYIEAEMKKWQFLFQIDSDSRLNISWGFDGTLDICIPKVSLAARRFEDCWTIMQDS